MANDRCPKCKRLTILADHTCPPAWSVADAGDLEWFTVYAYDAGDAAAQAAQDIDCSAAEVVSNREIFVRPANQPDSTPDRYVVHAEVLPTYTAFIKR